MPVIVSHALSMTTPDDPAYENKPSDWNSAHAVTLNIAATEISNLFGNANGVSFGLSGASITASHNGLTSQSPVAYSAGNGSETFSTLTFANSNGVSFSTGTQGLYATVKTDYLTTARASNDAIGLNTAQSNVTWTVNSSGLSLDARGYAGTGTSGTNVSLTLNSNGLAASVTAQSVQPVAASGSNGSFAFSTLSFGNLNGLSFYTSNGSIVGSYTDGGGGGGSDGYNSAQFAGSTANSTMPILWAGNSNGSGNITFGLTGSTVTASHGGLTSQSNQAFSAGGGSSAFQTLSFGDANGVTWSNVGGAIQASYTQSTHSHATPAYSGSNGSFTAATLTFGNLNGLSFYTSNGSIVGSYTDGGGGGGSFSAGMSNLGNTAGTSGMVGNRLVLVGSGEIGLSQSTDTNGATVSIYEIPSYKSNYRNHSGIIGTLGALQPLQATCLFGYMNLGADYSFDWVANLRSVNVGAVTVAANATLINTSFGVTQLDTFRQVLYTRGSGASSLSLFSISSSTYTLGWNATVSVGAQSTQFSATEAMSYFVSGTAQSTFSTQYSMSSASFSLSTAAKSAFTGLKQVISDFPGTLSAGEYWMAFGQSTSVSTNLAAGSSLTAGRVVMTVGAQSLTNAGVASQFGVVSSNAQLLPFVGVANVTATSAVAMSQFTTNVSNQNALIHLGRLV